MRSLGDFADASGQLCVKKGMRGKGKSSVVVGGDDSKKYVTEVKSPSSDSRNNNEQKLEGGVQDLDAERLTVESTKPDGEKCDVVKEKISVSECTTTVNIHEDSNSVPVHELTMRHLMALETAVANPVPKDGVAFLSRPVGLLNDCKTDTQPNHSGAELRDSDGILNDCDKRNESIVPVNNTNCLEVLKEPSLMTMDARERLEKLKQGWTLKDCGSISVGEVYLMVGLLTY